VNKLTKGAVVTAAILGGSVAMGGQAFASAGAEGAAVESPGVLSGNNVQVPVHVPINICGNTVDVVSALNPTFGNTCVNGDMAPGHPEPPRHHAPDDECPPEMPPPSDDCAGEAQHRGGEDNRADVAAMATTAAGALLG
jgi:hypothetical protein